ncbi:putative death-specific protein [Skeletonema marinoi]|uniref:Death-specific protein n=1 Tax=Skeletonema marinoi TaxID=267567 RepID=A0AAD8XUC5_9STRA|nr:putative death-specific protein [Skeletonema marinoi]
MMNNKQTLLAIMALAAAHSSSAFVVNTQARAISYRPLSYSTGDTMTNDYTDVTATTSEQSSKLIMDIPPTPVAPKNKPAPKKKANAAHKEGVFSHRHGCRHPSRPRSAQQSTSKGNHTSL